ncbi:MAG TPA: dihydroorotate dehydrogenase electron transfer subunit [Bacteroidetes bacterium]|nr:dihydroorotate dehydrogenase electron transfer subunit [Bacteroidota bacterium]
MTDRNNTPIAEKGVVEQVRKISGSVWDMTIHSPAIAGASRAGQFVHVRVSDGFNPFLRRPLSVGPCRGDYLRLIFVVKGVGTRLLAGKHPGDIIDMIGPLGNPFPAPETDQYPILVAGGIGMVPLLLMDNQFVNSIDHDFLLGMRSSAHQTVDDVEIKRLKIVIASDDGSIGYHGTVIDLLENRLTELKRRKIVVYGCGPVPMLQSLKEVCVSRSIPAYISLEVSMGCGVGACQSCAVPRADGDGYYLVCRDGPAFRASAVDLNAGGRS